MNRSSTSRRRRGRERGSALIEFLLATALIILPLLIGTFVIGMSLVRANQVAEVSRDAAHMYAYGVDFSQTSSQNLLLELAQGLNMTLTGGNGVVILSTVTYVGDNDCLAAGIQPGDCPNDNSTVFTRQIVVGNSALQGSAFGTPSAAIIGSGGNITTMNYLTNASARANNFASVITLSSGQYAYVAETFVISPDFNIFGGGLISPGGISARSIF